MWRRPCAGSRVWWGWVSSGAVTAVEVSVRRRAEVRSAGRRTGEGRYRLVGSGRVPW
ncbi:hypothetical protein AB0N17_28735 [Streptomyces sp. NPDC051133]|uniref:hypothetical protein n=1 Tax=Streptomyces sp. NPDC051133 TaxID=3155521 RepID=UPI00343BF65C